jgi:hypothetical protein
MAQTAYTPTPTPDRRRTGIVEPFERREPFLSGISWAAVFGGATVAAASSLTLLVLGAGIGLSSVSPWSTPSSNATAIGAATILWMVVSAIIASALGGYLAGRLRSKWVNVHSDEVYFRDTAHGFLVWSLGVVIAAGFLASVTAFTFGGAARTATPGFPSADSNFYFVESMFRSNNPVAADRNIAVRAEAAGILANDLSQPDFPDADRAYLTRLVAADTGLSIADAQKRVSDTLEQARLAADNARRAAAHLSYWTFFALLVGAFCASLAATFGGMQRDRVPVTQGT